MRYLPLRGHPLRRLAVSLIAVGVLVALLAALTGFLLLLALLIGLTILNMIYLPRAAMRLRIPVGWLALMLIPFMILAGFIIGGAEGIAWGAAIWLVAIGLPRAIAGDLVRRARQRVGARLPYYEIAARPVVEPNAKKPTGDRGGRPLPSADDRGQGEYDP